MLYGMVQETLGIAIPMTTPGLLCCSLLQISFIARAQVISENDIEVVRMYVNEEGRLMKRILPVPAACTWHLLISSVIECHSADSSGTLCSVSLNCMPGSHPWLHSIAVAVFKFTLHSWHVVTKPISCIWQLPGLACHTCHVERVECKIYYQDVHGVGFHIHGTFHLISSAWVYCRCYDIAVNVWSCNCCFSFKEKQVTTDTTLSQLQSSQRQWYLYKQHNKESCTDSVIGWATSTSVPRQLSAVLLHPASRISKVYNTARSMLLTKSSL